MADVIGFSDLPEPPEWEYRLGIAYPMRARIDGEGVGAVRRCEFSTGPFVEPDHGVGPAASSRVRRDAATTLDDRVEPVPERAGPAPRGLHDVARRRVPAHPPPEGKRTRLEGTTHYTLAIYPKSSTGAATRAAPAPRDPHARASPHQGPQRQPREPVASGAAGSATVLRGEDDDEREAGGAGEREGRHGLVR